MVLYYLLGVQTKYGLFEIDGSTLQDNVGNKDVMEFTKDGVTWEKLNLEGKCHKS